MPQREQKITLLKGERVARNVDYRDYLPVNCTPVIRQLLGAEGYMLQEPGLTLLGTGPGKDRGGRYNAQQNKHFRVNGSKFVEVGEDGTVTELGTVGVGAFPVSLPYSVNTQAIISNGKYFLYDATNGFREVTDPELGTPIDGTWADALYIFTDGEFLFHTDANNESAIDPLKYSGSDFEADPIKGVSISTDNKLIAWNRYTIEFFVNEATEDFQYTRIPSRNVQHGLVATHLKAEIGGEWFFVGGPKEGDVSVYALAVGGAKEIASREVVKVLGQYTEAELANSVLESRVEETYTYLILHLPNDCLKCNLNLLEAAGKEFAWSKLITDTTGSRPWRAIHGVQDPRLGWVYGDKRDGSIGLLDDTVATHYGAKVENVLYTPFIYLEAMSIDEMEVFTIPGFNTTDDAKALLSISYDGQHFGTEVPIVYSTPGDYKARFLARRLGYVDDWFQFRVRWISTSRMAFALARILYG